MLERQRGCGVPYLQETLLPAQADDVLELDELWSYVGSKKEAVWMWIALCRRTRQVVAWHFGPRDEISCLSLWHKIPPDYKALMCYSDFWDSYQKIIPAQQHTACGKEEGQTNHVERFNLTLRQRVARFVRKTLSFSKKLIWHLRHFRFFLVNYNHYCIHRFNSH